MEKEKKKKKKKLPKNVRERDGKFTYRYSIKNPVTGKRKQKESDPFPTATQAETEGVRIKASLLNGTYLEKADLTVDAWSEEWHKWYSSTGEVKDITADQRSEMVDLLTSKIGGLTLQETTEDIYQGVLHDLNKTHSQNTLISFHSCCKMIFARAVQKGKIKTDPTQYAYIPKKALTFDERESAKQLPRFLEKGELKLFLAAEKDPQMKRIFELLAYTGMRIGELSALFVLDYDGEDLLRISKTRYVPKSVKNYQLTSPKNKSSDRTIHLSNRAVTVIKDQLAWRKEFAFSKGPNFYKERQFMFFCEKARAGYPLHYTRILTYMKKALKEAKLPETLSPHSLRHTYTSLMAEAEADLDTIQAQLGHKKGSEVTKAIYLHVTKAREKRDVGRLDALLDAMD